MRTVRGLENGEITSPHGSTLLALVSAMELSREQADQFLRTWDGMRRIRVYGDVMTTDERSGLLRATQEGLMRSFLDKRVVSATRLIKVGPSRLIEQEWYQTVIEALDDDVDTHLVVARGAKPHEDMRLWRFEDLVGCSVRHRDIDGKANIAVVELSLGESLREGATKTIAWREVNGWADPGLVAGRTREFAADTKYSNTFLRPISFLSMQIAFDCARPSRIWELSGGQRPERTRTLTLDDYGTTSVIWQNSPPGRFGIEWEWPEAHLAP